MRRTKRWLWPVMAAVIVTACDDWPQWDAVFDRSSLGASGRGWIGGDGAINSRLPGSNRALWIFGDSFIGGIDANHQRTNASFLMGNTLAVQSDTHAPDPGKIEFYARKLIDGCTTVLDGAKPACPIARVTRDAPDAYLSVLNHKAFGLAALPGKETWGVWPLGSAYIDAETGDDLVIVSTTEAVVCNPMTESPCFPVCADPSNCTTGLKLARNILGRVVNAQAPPTSWSIASGSAVIDTDVYWGTSFLQEGGTVYIYGVDKLTQSKLLVARAPIADVLAPTKWEYLVNSLWKKFTSPPSASQLPPIATGVAALPTVTKVVRNGTTGYVLVHDHTDGDHFLYVRTSTSRTSFAPISAATPKLDLASIDKTLQWLQAARVYIGACTYVVHNGESDLRACGQSYHGKATPDISPRLANGDMQFLYFSYVVPHGFDDTANDSRYYVPKFGFVPIDQLSPWCTGSGCWTGIAREFARTTISAGQDIRYAFDVTQSNKLRVELTGGTGNPNLFVRFDSPAAGTSGDTCARTANSFPETCDLTMSNKTTAHILVRGATAGSYNLRVVYDGQ